MATNTSTAARESAADDDGTEIHDGGPEAARAGRRRRRADPAADRRRLDLRPRRADQGAPHLGGGRRGADGPVRPHRALERPLAGAGRLGRSLGDGGDPRRRPRPRRQRPDDGARRARGDAEARRRRVRGDPEARSRRARRDPEARRRRARRDPEARRRPPPTASPSRSPTPGRRCATRLRRWSTRSSRRSTPLPPMPRRNRRAPRSASPPPARSSPG